MPPCIDLEALFAETRPTEVVVECRPNGDLPLRLRPGIFRSAGCGEHGGSTDRSGLRVSTLTGQVRCPVVHEPAPALEQVRAHAGRLDPVPDYMREGRLDVNDLPLGVIELKNPAEGHRLDGPDSSFRPTKRSSRRCSPSTLYSSLRTNSQHVLVRSLASGNGSNRGPRLPARPWPISVSPSCR